MAIGGFPTEMLRTTSKYRGEYVMRKALSHWARLSVLPAALTIVGCASDRVAVRDRATEDASVENWAARHPEAAHELGAWAHDNPEAAKFVFEYDGRHPERNREMILWAIYHPGEDIMVFAAKHPGWEWFDNVMAKHQAGAGRFLEWTRHHPIAVEELIGHPSGLLWAGEHLYAAEWRH